MKDIAWEYIAKIGSINLTVCGELTAPPNKPSAALDAVVKQIIGCGVSENSIRKIDVWPLKSAEKS